MLKIEVIEYDQSLVPFLDAQSKLFIDIDCGEDVGYTKQFTELSEFGKLKIDGATDFTIQKTKKNRAIFDKYISLTSRCIEIDPIYVRVSAGSFIFPEDILIFITDDNSTIDVRITYKESHWAYQIQDKKLTDYDLDANGVVNLDYSPTLANWAKPIWQDGDPLIWLPLVKYGQLRNREINNGESSLSRPLPYNQGDIWRFSDLRQWISALGLLRTILGSHGWCLKSKFLESDEGRSIWMYLLKPDYYLSAKNRGRWLNFQVMNSTNLSILPVNFGLGTVQFNQKILGNYDEGNNYVMAPTTESPFSFWANPLCYSHEFKFKTRLIIQNTQAFNKDFRVKIILAERGNITNIIDEVTFTETIAGNTTKTYTYEWLTNAEVNTVAFVTVVTLLPTSTTLLLLTGSRFRGDVSGKMYYKGDDLSLNGAVKDYPVPDALKGILHAINGKVVTDFATKTVFIEPYPTHLKDEFTDFPGQLVCDSLKPIQKDVQYGTYILKFKDSTDAKIEEDGKAATKWAKKLVINPKLKELYVDENPFFEPLGNTKLDYWTPTQVDGARSLSIPFITDNLDDQVTYDIGPRIAMAIGYVEQNSNEGITTWLFDHFAGAPPVSNALPQPQPCAEEKTFLPYLAQMPEAFIGVNREKSQYNLVYGDKANDLYFRFHRKQILEDFYSKNYEILGDISLKDFMNEDFTHRYSTKYNGQPLKLILKAVKDFKLNKSNLPSILLFSQDKFNNLSDPCSCVHNWCTFFMDMAPTITTATLNNLRLKAFKVDNVNYVITPIVLGPKVTILYKTYVYVLNLVNAINSLNIKGVEAFPDLIFGVKQIPQKYFRLRTPECSTWEMIVESISPAGEIWRWTEEGFFFNTPNGWSQNYESDYLDFLPYNCETITTEVIC